MIVKLIRNIKGFLQYYHEATKNKYSCKLIGEKRCEKTNASIIVFRKIGQSKSLEISVKELLADSNLVSQFHPIAGLRIGSIALEEFIFELLPSERRYQFNKVKNIMLNSNNDIGQSFNIEKSQIKETLYSAKNNYRSDSTIHIKSNTYSCKLVGGKYGNGCLETKIIFTILGKREGYEKTLRDLIIDNDLLEKFHPTEAVKFGFISLGDLLLEFSESYQKQELNYAINT